MREPSSHRFELFTPEVRLIFAFRFRLRRRNLQEPISPSLICLIWRKFLGPSDFQIRFRTLIVLEGVICQFRWSKGRFRFNDSLASMSHATCLRVFELIGEVAIEYHMYILAYEKWHAFEMNPESRTTWILALLGADLSYYWAHRAMHEVNLMWSAHQAH